MLSYHWLVAERPIGFAAHTPFGTFLRVIVRFRQSGSVLGCPTPWSEAALPTDQRRPPSSVPDAGDAVDRQAAGRQPEFCGCAEQP
jgi:hypothetical protein